MARKGHGVVPRKLDGDVGVGEGKVHKVFGYLFEKVKYLIK